MTITEKIANLKRKREIRKRIENHGAGDFARARAFREEALERGLILDQPYLTGEPYFFFDLNLGSVETHQNLDEVWTLVKLAREYSDIGGEHNSLFGTYARKSELNTGADRIDWRRMRREAGGEDAISLREYLTQRGYGVSEVLE